MPVKIARIHKPGKVATTLWVRANRSRLGSVQRAKTTLRQVRFSSGIRLGPVELSPALSDEQRRAVEFWIHRLPAAFRSRLPRLKLAVADKFNPAPSGGFTNKKTFAVKEAAAEHTHAVSFIAEGYIVANGTLFRRRVEFGRILYHEFCHFVWPRLGNSRRHRKQTVLQRELRNHVRGELGYSSELRKEGLSNREKSHMSRSSSCRRKLDYFCESFCDTGAYVLLGSLRRQRHSEYTLGASARKRRCRAWQRIVLEGTPDPKATEECME